MSYRPLVLASGITAGDYLLWKWSLNGNHDVLALVSGLTLPPLVLASLWLLALVLTRLLAARLRRPAVRGARAGRRARFRRPAPVAPVSVTADTQSAAAQARADARKLAA